MGGDSNMNLEPIGPTLSTSTNFHIILSESLRQATGTQSLSSSHP